MKLLLHGTLAIAGLFMAPQAAELIACNCGGSDYTVTTYEAPLAATCTTSHVATSCAATTYQTVATCGRVRLGDRIRARRAARRAALSVCH